MRAVSREAGGIIELMPSLQLWDNEVPFVTTNKRNYTLGDLPDLFSDMGSPITTDVFNSVKNVVGNLKPPK